MAHFFISYNHHDAEWAKWIAWVLEEAGSGTILQAWDFPAGSNFVLEMQQAAAGSERTIAVLSQEYLASGFAAAEWAAAFKMDPTGAGRKLIPVRVAECDPEGLLGPIVFIDLLGLDEKDAQELLLTRILVDERAKPGKKPRFAGGKASHHAADAERPAFPAGRPALWDVPYARNPYFTGRKEVLKALRRALTAKRATALTQAIRGLGGIGKTQTAVEYAYCHRGDYRAVLWVRADAETTLTSEYSRLAARLDLPEKDAKDPAEAREAVKRWLAEHEGYLLVLDNADKPPIVKPFLPADPAGHILITSRAHDFAILHIGGATELRVLPESEALRFLLIRTGRERCRSAERDAAKALAVELGGLPLALEQAGAYIAVSQARFQDYLKVFRDRPLDLLEKQRPEIGDYDRTVAKTWSINFEAVQQESPATAELLYFSAFLGPDRIPDELLVKGASEIGEKFAAAMKDVGADPLRLDELLQPAVSYSLIRRDRDASTYDIHRLEQAVIRAGMDDKTRRAHKERTVRAVDEAFPDIEYSNWPDCNRLLPHALACAKWIEMDKMEFSQAARLLNQTGFYLRERAQYAAAEPLYCCALAIYETALGPEHPHTAASLDNLAGLYASQGQYAAAEPLFRRALAISETALGPEHPDTATSLNNLAALYRSQGQYAAAEPLCRRALAIYETALGPEHPHTAASLDNLAGLYASQGQYAAAEPLYRRALAIRETALGPEHPATATSLNNLAALYSSQGQYAAAEPLYRRALAIRETALGPEHPDTATSLNNLAALYSSQGQYAAAEPLYRRALAIRETALGPEHPSTATSLNNLAALYYSQGLYNDALSLLLRSLAIFEKVLPPIHPDLAVLLENCAVLYSQTGQEGQAEKTRSRAEAIRTTHQANNPAT